MNVAVIGAGKMGLPLACHLASRGASVLACDVNTDLVGSINQGRCPIDEPGVPNVLAAMVSEGRLRATSNTIEAVKQSDVVIVIVPALLTPDRHVDLSILESVSRQISSGLHKGLLISYETTLPVGATRHSLKPLLEATGARAGEDFFLAFSPERVKSQMALERLKDTPKVVGGVNAESAKRAEDFYSTYLGAPLLNVGTLEAAEMVKLAGMIYRDVNIALANELTRYASAHSVDMKQVIEAANTDGEAYLLRPGIGVGGHCTPIYPYFMIHDANRRGIPITLAERSRHINDEQPDYSINQLESSWEPLTRRRVLILGLGFRPQVKEHICSPAFLLKDALARRGSTVTLHDPLYSAGEVRAHGFTPGEWTDEPGPEVLIGNTAHSRYKELDFSDLATRGVRAVLDGCSCWDPGAVRQHGIFYLGIGRP
jgi:nucleotide sugar dehydrogenase